MVDISLPGLRWEVEFMIEGLPRWSATAQQWGLRIRGCSKPCLPAPILSEATTA
jgi:hypothetical protein